MENILKKDIKKSVETILTENLISEKIIYNPKVRKKYGIFFRASIFIALILVARIMIELYSLAIIPLNGLITALISGVFFTIGILFAGAASDYKEAEKLPGELAVSLKSLYADSKIISDSKNKEQILEFQQSIKNLLYTINSQFRKNQFKLKEINIALDKVNEHIQLLNEKGVAPGFLTRWRAELTNIDKICHRIDTISENRFIPAAYTIAEIGIGCLVLVLLFLKSDIPYLTLIMLGIISSTLISLLILIKDMDNPFELGINYANVDLSLLMNLERFWKLKN